jgi:hypothetical protein
LSGKFVPFGYHDQYSASLTESKSSYAEICLSNQNNGYTKAPNFLHLILVHKYQASNTLQLAKYHETFKDYKSM